jgi:hypothetical protein
MPNVKPQMGNAVDFIRLATISTPNYGWIWGCRSQHTRLRASSLGSQGDTGPHGPRRMCGLLKCDLPFSEAPYVPQTQVHTSPEASTSNP